MAPKCDLIVRDATLLSLQPIALPHRSKVSDLLPPLQRWAVRSPPMRLSTWVRLRAQPVQRGSLARRRGTDRPSPESGTGWNAKRLANSRIWCGPCRPSCCVRTGTLATPRPWSRHLTACWRRSRCRRHQESRSMLLLVALVPQWRQDYPNNQTPRPAAVISAAKRPNRSPINRG
jgi:hypothetical protein